MSHLPLFRGWFGTIALAVLAVVVCGEAPSVADSGPLPPCGGEQFPPYPALGNPPVVKVWEHSGLGRDWIPPACTGWAEPGFSSLVVTVARFRHTSGAEGLRRHLGAISELSEMFYWSTTHKRWQKLIVGAYALSAPSGDRRRKDFSTDEVATGQSLFFQQQDNLSGKAVYRIRVDSASRDRLVFEIENITTMHYFLVPLFHPGEMQSIYFLDRESNDVWRYYSISRTGKNASSLTAGHEASSINRAVAYYRYLAGIPMNQEPPAAP